MFVHSICTNFSHAINYVETVDIRNIINGNMVIIIMKITFTVQMQPLAISEYVRANNLMLDVLVLPSIVSIK